MLQETKYYSINARTELQQSKKSSISTKNIFFQSKNMKNSRAFYEQIPPRSSFIYNLIYSSRCFVHYALSLVFSFHFSVEIKIRKKLKNVHLKIGKKRSLVKNIRLQLLISFLSFFIFNTLLIY